MLAPGAIERTALWRYRCFGGMGETCEVHCGSGCSFRGLGYLSLFFSLLSSHTSLQGKRWADEWYGGTASEQHEGKSGKSRGWYDPQLLLAGCWMPVSDSHTAPTLKIGTMPVGSRTRKRRT